MRDQSLLRVLLSVSGWERKRVIAHFKHDVPVSEIMHGCCLLTSTGMSDIAHQTVEFLYEENGGIPRDLHLPTLDDIRDELSKFTIECVRKGTTVVIKMPTGAGGATVLPKFAIRGMLKTFGLTGFVLDVDQVCVSFQLSFLLPSHLFQILCVVDVSDKLPPCSPVVLPRQSLLPLVHIYTVRPPPLRSSFPSHPSSSFYTPHILYLFSWHVCTALTLFPALSWIFLPLLLTL